MKLMNVRDDLFEKKKGLNLSLEKSDNQIKDFIKKQKSDSAKYSIKCKKLYEEYLRIVEDKYIFIQKMIIEVQKKIMDKSLVDVMKNTNALLKDIQKSINVNEMQEMMENLQENSEKHKEINELFKKYNADDEQVINDEYNLIEAQLAFKDVNDKPIINMQKIPYNNSNKNEKLPQKAQNNVGNNRSDDIDERLAELA